MCEMLANKKHQEFINQLFLLNFNGTRAYQAAYGDVDENTAAVNASKLLRNTKIAEEIEARLFARQMSADEALDIITSHARADMGEFLDVSGMGFALNLQEAKAKGLTKVIRKIKQRTTTFIAKNESDEDREVHELEIELYDAQAAADKVLRVAGKYKNSETDLGNFTLTIKREGEA